LLITTTKMQSFLIRKTSRTMSRIDHLKQKAARYCAYRDRCTAEVEIKLLQLEATQPQLEEVIHWLKNEKYLDDARFAATFARSKFKSNKWGRNRIVMELKTRNIDPVQISQALKEINNEEYIKVLQSLAHKKIEQVKDDDPYIIKQKTAVYLQGKGFEPDLIWQVLEKQP